MSRREVTFISGTDTCAAWLYEAEGPDAGGCSPVIVMAHGLTGTRRDRLGAFAERFSRAGIAAVVFDQRGFGDSTGEPDHVDPAMQLEDSRAAIACAIAAAERPPVGELRTYPGVGHFDIYDGPEHEAVVAHEAEFLRRHLRPAT